MKAIHIPSWMEFGHSILDDMISDKNENNEKNCDILEFCFKYDVQPLFTKLKTKICKIISERGSNARWIEFFHRFKNVDNSEVFEDQTNAMRLLVS